MSELITAKGTSEDDLLGFAAAVEQRSQHPLARAIVAAAADSGAVVGEVDDFMSLPGAGATATVNGHRGFIGSPTLMEDRHIDTVGYAEQITDLQSTGTTAVAVTADDITKLSDALHLGRRTRRLVTQNLALSLVILVILVPGALIGWFSLPVAVAAHELSELFVILNGVRAARS